MISAPCQDQDLLLCDANTGHSLPQILDFSRLFWKIRNLENQEVLTVVGKSTQEVSRGAVANSAQHTSRFPQCHEPCCVSDGWVHGGHQSHALQRYDEKGREGLH